MGRSCRRSGRTLAALATGAAAGLVVAAAALWTWTLLAPARRGPAVPPREIASAVDVFRLPSGGGRELVVVRAGPDATGETALSARLFPGEAPARELVSIVVANAAGGEPWTIDLAAAPLRVRAGGGWEPAESVALRGTELPPAEELRLRSLGGATSAIDVAPGTMRSLLVALPKARKMSELTDVQWGDVNLLRDRFDLERLRRFRVEGRVETATAGAGR